MALTSDAIKGMVEHLYETVSFVTYLVSGTYYNAYINSIFENAANIQIYLTLPNTGGSMTVTEINVYNSHSELWYTTIVAITSLVDVSVVITAAVTVS
jgi:hypothetical protein